MSKRKKSSTAAVIILLSGLLAFQVYTFLSEERRPTRGDSPVLFDFNPNTISHDSLLLLGFSDAQARGIENYRSKGGKFRRKEDFARMYTVSPEKYLMLEPFIVIPEIYSKSSERKLNHTAGDYSNGYNDYRSGRRPYGMNRSRDIYQRKKWSGYDSIQNAGGFRRDTDSTMAPRPKFQRTDTIDLNFADSSDLTSLRGIGGYYARRIIEYRDRLGFFYSDSQLLEIPGIDSARFAGLRNRVRVSVPLQPVGGNTDMEFDLRSNGKATGSASSSTPYNGSPDTSDTTDTKKRAEADYRIALAELTDKELSSHPYIGAFAARSMSFIRKKYGAAALTLENLLRQGVITAALARKLAHYFK